MKKTKIPSLIPILVLTLITVIMWVFFDIFRILKTTPELAVPTTISQPLTPSLDQDSINQIESRIFLNDSQIPNNNIVASPSPTPKVSAAPQPSSTPSATIQPSEASSSATTQ